MFGPAEAPPLERVIVSADGRGFVLAESKTPFHPWGMNYGNAGRLMEDFWDTDWETLAVDFRELKALGANAVRVNLQFGKFMIATYVKPKFQLVQACDRSVSAHLKR